MNTLPVNVPNKCIYPDHRSADQDSLCIWQFLLRPFSQQQAISPKYPIAVSPQLNTWVPEKKNKKKKMISHFKVYNHNNSQDFYGSFFFLE